MSIISNNNCQHWLFTRQDTGTGPGLVVKASGRTGGAGKGRPKSSTWRGECCIAWHHPPNGGEGQPFGGHAGDQNGAKWSRVWPDWVVWRVVGDSSGNRKPVGMRVVVGVATLLGLQCGNLRDPPPTSGTAKGLRRHLSDKWLDKAPSPLSTSAKSDRQHWLFTEQDSGAGMGSGLLESRQGYGGRSFQANCPERLQQARGGVPCTHG